MNMWAEVLLALLGAAPAWRASLARDRQTAMPLSPDSSDSEVDLLAPAIAICVEQSSPAKPTMPPAFTSAACLVEHQEGTNAWIVRMGEDVPKFLYANGPARIVRYNFNTIREHTQSEYVIRRQRSKDKQGFDDVFELTSAGRAVVGTVRGWQVDLACTGRSFRTSPDEGVRRATTRISRRVR